jgi:hypothetical protein
MQGGLEMEALSYRDPDEPDRDDNTCQDVDWDDEAASEQEDVVLEEARLIVDPVSWKLVGYI